MAVTMEQVLAALRPDEPDYKGASSLGQGALPFLADLIQGSDSMLASKAAYLTGVIGGPRSGAIMMKAAANNDPIVRAAAAGTAVHLPAEVSGPVLVRLLGDAHADVRRIAVQSVPPGVSPTLHQALRKTAETDPDLSIRGLSQEALRRTRPE